MTAIRETSAGARPFEVSNRLVLSIALPMMLAYLTTPLLGIVDTAVIGRLGDAALLGGLAAGAIIFDLVFATFNFLRTGTTGLVAQAYGRGDAPEEQAVFWRALIVAVGAGVLLVAAAPLVVLGGARFMAAEPAVTEAMATYVSIRLVSAPFALTNYAILGYVLGRGEAGLGLGLQLALNVVNMALSVALGLWMGWGVAGVAWATVAAEAFAALVGMSILVLRFRRLPPLAQGTLRNVAALRTMFALNRDIMIRSFVLLGAFALFARQGAQLGTLTLAANAVLMNFFLLSGYFLDGFATAAEQLAGRAVGARHRPAFMAAVRLTAIWGFAVSAGVALLFLVFGNGLVALMTTSADVRAMAADYLPWAALTAVSGVLAFQMDGVFMGSTWSRDLRNMMLASFALFIAALVVLVPLLGNPGLWASLHVFLIARGLSLFAIMPVRARATFEN
ncbi:MATE family efflux transporter [Mesorhizobium microcysteis]|jgi:MATE family multidrug resistance protein|uniref:MATE family efflux transporter n=1 Tax=Neoaquamicrobium microcysteis TaxID=2682781 RepID=A0A5D4GS30_9HYPH|nr:MATE family efflux transporter [Mesorhizobium microcysteis]TYR29380.1 MATE family efflux transporter [Mesorhizobium microcysteis]